MRELNRMVVKSKPEKLNWQPLRTVVSTRVSVDKLKGRREKSQATSRKGGGFVIP
jgi:hypothetical protein